MPGPAGATAATDCLARHIPLVSLELGGALADPANLWVEPGKIPNPKDAVENKLHSAVCSGLIPLATAQKAIAGNWTTAFDDAGLRIAGGKVCLRDTPAKCTTSHRGDEDGNWPPTSPRDVELAGNVFRRPDSGTR